MDNLFEHLYKYRKKPADYLVQAMIFIATMAVACAGYFLIGMLLPAYGIISVGFGRFLGILVIMGCVYVGYKVFMKFDIEYEYIYFAGEIDFDKILSKTNRSRLLTAKCDTFERFGEYTPEVRQSMKNETFDKLFDFTSNTGAKRYYAVLKHREYKKTVVIFEPTEDMVADMKRFMKNVSFYR